MRKPFIAVLVLLLIGSVITNLTLVKQIVELERDIVWWQSEMVRIGKAQGVRQADSDFAAGHPAYYVTGQFFVGDLGTPPVLKERPGRVVVGLGCDVTHFDVAFVNSYNERMEALFTSKPSPAELKH